MKYVIVMHIATWTNECCYVIVLLIGPIATNRVDPVAHRFLCTGVDPVARRFLWNVISEICTERQDCAVVLTTHVSLHHVFPVQFPSRPLTQSFW